MACGRRSTAAATYNRGGIGGSGGELRKEREEAGAAWG
jgi:hypothetical protein